MVTVEPRRSSRRAVYHEENETSSPGKKDGQSVVGGDLSLKDMFQEGMESIAVHRCVASMAGT